MSDRCPLCTRRKAEGSPFCSLHHTAFTNLENAFPIWNAAFGDLNKDDYFSKLSQLPETGEAVKRMIQYLRRQTAVT